MYSLPPDILGEAMHTWGHIPLNSLTASWEWAQQGTARIETSKILSQGQRSLLPGSRLVLEKNKVDRTKKK